MAQIDVTFPGFTDTVPSATFTTLHEQRKPTGEETVAEANTLAKRARIRVDGRRVRSDGSYASDAAIYPLGVYVDAETTPNIPPAMTKEKLDAYNEVLGYYWAMHKTRAEARITADIAAYAAK